ncbi:protein kinase domain-containing protein [Bryobacter aggregatus]|uniref:protein kinase domain-containing protein n=1 Tax=Bryobacter aggregatus TaxID=360054 RepID=UPI00068E5A88|nr:protein kinase [Bryobacter aggregatus]
MDPLVGRTLDNKYLIEKLLGKGGMGSVYMALHTGTKRTVAVKIIAPQYMRNRELLIRFQREAEASGRLRHPNVVNVTDFGVTVIDTRPLAYLVMEYLDGETLFEMLQKQPLLPSSLAVEILEQISLGVSEAHRHGILHRDLKPQNIWMQPDGRGAYIVKVLDFGIAKLADPSALVMDLPELEAAPNAETNPEDENATQIIAPTELGLTSAFADASGFTTTVGSTLGTPAFMSPEQCSGKAVNEKSDLYSLAMLAYMMLAGELPFKGNARELIEQQITLTPDAPHTKNPKLSEIVSRVILESLAKDPNYRAPNCQSFVARMRVAVEGEVRILKDSRALGSGNSGVWFAILLLVMVPAVTILNGFRSLGRLATERQWLEDWQAFAIVLVIHFLVAYCALLWADMGMTRWFQYTRDQDGTVKSWFAQMMSTWKCYPRALIATCFTTRPVSDALAHIVILLEHRSVKQARLRSRELLRGNEHIALALLVRRFAVAWLVALYLPIAFVIGQAPLRVIFHEYLGEGFSNALSLASFSFMPIYGSFLLAWSMLYERARRSLGENSVEVMQRSGNTLSRVGQRIRLGTMLWAAIPVLLLLGLILPPSLGWNETFGNNLGSAVLEGRLKDAEAYLKNGADVNGGRGPGRYPFRQAVENGDRPMAELLLRYGASPDGYGGSASPLHYAVMRHHPEMIRFLLDHGAKTEVYDNTHDTPLSLAAKSNQIDAALILLAGGANRNTKDISGKTPLDHALAQNHLALAKILESK